MDMISSNFSYYLFSIHLLDRIYQLAVHHLLKFSVSILIQPMYYHFIYIYIYVQKLGYWGQSMNKCCNTDLALSVKIFDFKNEFQIGNDCFLKLDWISSDYLNRVHMRRSSSAALSIIDFYTPA